VISRLGRRLLSFSANAAAVLTWTRRGRHLTISIGVPRRYSYSPNEVVDLDDLAGAVQFVWEMEHHEDLGFL